MRRGRDKAVRSGDWPNTIFKIGIPAGHKSKCNNEQSTHHDHLLGNEEFSGATFKILVVSVLSPKIT